MNQPRTKDEIWEKGYDYGGGFYIHLHQKDIGAMLTHKSSTSESLVRTFRNQKYNARQALQNQYKELLKANVNQNEVDALERLFEDNGSLEKIDQALKQYFQESLNSDNVKKLIEKQKNISWGSSKNFKKILTDTSKTWEGFDSLLTNIADCIEILNNTDGPAIAAVIRNAQKKKTIGGVGRYLEKSLKNKIIDNTTIQGQNLNKALDTLKIFARRLATGDKSGKTKEMRTKDDPITIEFLKSSIDRNFFSTILGESAAMDVQTLGVTTSYIYMQDAINNIRSTGKDPTVRLKSNQKGSYVGDIKIGEKRQGKADVKFDNVVVSIDDILDSQNGYGNITFSIGLSNKAYKTLSLGKDGQLTNNSLVTGGSININDVFEMLTNQERIKYLGYNVLAWTSNSAPKELQDEAFDLDPALSALQDALFTRSTLYLFGARGKIDFSNFMFINGQLISMLEIVNRVVGQNDIATTSTMNKDNGKQGVIFSIPGRGKWWDKLTNNDIYNHTLRTQTLNAAINSTRIEGHINPFGFN